MKTLFFVALALFACAMAAEETKEKRDLLLGNYPYGFGVARSVVPGVTAYTAGAYPYGYNYGAYPYAYGAYPYNHYGYGYSHYPTVAGRTIVY